MNVLFFIGLYPNYGGTERITTLLANSFVLFGWKVFIVSCESGCSLEKMRLSSEVVFCSLPDDRMHASSRKNEEAICTILKKERIDVIINQWCLPFQITRMLNRARKATPNVRLISVLHGIPHHSKRIISLSDQLKTAPTLFSRILAWVKLNATDSVIRWSIKYVCRHSDKYVLLSPRFIQCMKEYARLSASDLERVLAIGNPISIRTDYNNPSYMSNKKKQLLYVGRLDKENKRVNRIIEVWEHLYAKCPEWNLVLVGDGPHRIELETYVKLRHIERVQFTGFVDQDPIDYYKESSILLLTSDLEGFGLVIVEGMSYGVVPVVYGSYESVYDIIDHGNNGYITSKPFNHEEMVSYIKELMDDDSLRQRMSYASQLKSKQFSVESIVEQWKKILER